jgi:hypothetical protein
MFFLNSSNPLKYFLPIDSHELLCRRRALQLVRSLILVSICVCGKILGREDCGQNTLQWFGLMIFAQDTRILSPHILLLEYRVSRAMMDGDAKTQ